jgi:DNA-binding CsgD family transcriptional regulator
VERDNGRATKRADSQVTPAESRVAAMLASGMNVREIAGACGVSVATVRSQLHSLFQKTGTRRQAELVCHLLREEKR